MNMKRMLLIATLVFAACASAPAQGSDKTQLASDTRIAAQLQQPLDARKAKVGDQVVLKTTEAIKSNGHTVAEKGARLVGHVTDVQLRADGSGTSSIGLVFDLLQEGSLPMPVAATLTSITQASARTGSNDTGAEASARTSGGGLLGGVLDTTTNAAGQAVGATTGAVSDVGVATPGLSITPSAGADAATGSTLTLTGGNLRLEKNTTFHFVLNESSSVNNRD